MTPYEIQFKSSAAKEFRKLPLEIKIRIRESINALKTEPRPIGIKKLAGETGLYQIRVGDHRVIYEIDDTAQIRRCPYPSNIFRSRKMMRYELIIYWSEVDKAFIGEVPELPGCAADGETYQEAVKNAEVVILRMA